MPLNKPGLKQAIEGVLRDNQQPNGGSNPEQQIENSIESLAQGIADAIHTYVSAATVTTPHGPGSLS